MDNRKFCGVCRQLGDGHHFGAVTCKPCAAFFKRTTGLKLGDKFKCRKGTEKCHISMSTRDSCKRCRYLKCLEVGMKPDLISEIELEASPQEVMICEVVPSPSYSPRSPRFDINLDQLRTPTLFKLYDNYRNLCSTRFKNHYNNLKSVPRPCTHVEFQTIYIDDVKLQNIFLEESFEEYKIMGKVEKQKVFKHFFVTFMLAEMGFRTLLEGRQDNFVVANGDFIDLQQLDKFYEEPDESRRCKPTDAVRIYQPAFTQIKRNVVDPFEHKNLTIVEFLALVSLSVWNESIDDNPQEFYHNCPLIKEKIIRDLVTYYQQDLNEPDPMFRLASIMMLLPSIERAIELFVQHVELKNMFQCYAFHQKLYSIICDI